MGKRPARAPAATRRKRAYRIFVSHATADKYVARVLCEKLEEIGVQTFRDDRDIAGGEVIPDRIEEEIRKSDEFVVLLTPKSVGRHWVLMEVGVAWTRKLWIVPILYHVEVDPIPDMLKSKRAFNLNDLDRYLAEVAQRAKGRVAK